MLLASPTDETVTSSFIPGRAKGGSVAVTKTAATFFTTTTPGAICTPIRCSELASVCTVKKVCCVSPVRSQANRQAITDQLIVAHALNLRYVANHHLVVRFGREERKREEQDPKG